MKHLTSHPELKCDVLRAMGYLGDTEGMVREALSNRRSPLWGALQETLFHLNLKLMSEGFALGTQRSELEWKFRALVESVEKEMLPKAHIPSHIIDSEEFIDWLKARIHEHRVTDHELFVYFDKNDLSDEEIRYFLSNYRVNMQRFHLHVAAYSLFVPFKMREELYENLYDEFGQGDFERAHPNLFEPLMEHFGGAREDDWNPETYHLLNTKINLCWFADGLQYGLGGMGALELTIPAQQRRVLANLRKRGLSETQVRFFVVHCELDEAHGDGWFAAGLPYIRSRSDFEKTYIAAMRMLDARAGVYDGILAGILRRRLEARGRKIAADQLQPQAQIA
jgi:pyrroloquinoline quinone (PQQ) biosynthesis protein C